MAPRTPEEFSRRGAWCHICSKIPDVVQVELPKLQAAISIACRLGFATRLPNPYEGSRHSSNMGAHHAETACCGDAMNLLPVSALRCVWTLQLLPHKVHTYTKACATCVADEGNFAHVPQFSLDFDLDSEHGLDAAPAERLASIGYSIAGLEEGTGTADGQGIALVVDAEV